MAAEDIRIKASARSNRKTKRLRARFGMAGWGHLTFLWLEASQERADGVLAGWTVEDVELAAEWDGKPGEFCQALLNIGFLDRDESGRFVIHDWPDHQPFVVTGPERSKHAAKAASARWSRPNSSESRAEDARSNAQSELGNAESKTSNAPTYLPTYQPSNQPTNPDSVESGSASPEPASRGVSASVVVEVWNTLVDGVLPKVLEITPKRKEKLKARQRPNRTRDWWEKYFRQIVASPFLRGENNRRWKADFDFAIRDENVVTKILEGGYGTEEPGAFDPYEPVNRKPEGTAS